jgi:hypothetical protein
MTTVAASPSQTAALKSLMLAARLKARSCQHPNSLHSADSNPSPPLPPARMPPREHLRHLHIATYHCVLHLQPCCVQSCCLPSCRFSLHPAAAHRSLLPCPHSNEEKLLFPWMTSKVKMPPRFSEDHDTLLKQMDSCTTALDQVERSGSAEQDAAMIKAFLVCGASVRTESRRSCCCSCALLPVVMLRCTCNVCCAPHMRDGISTPSCVLCDWSLRCC